jgi:class 3 adenylate cyclase
MAETTILFTDIEGSTALLERLGDSRWLDVLHQHNDIVRAQVYTHGGREVKTQGDGFMLAFAEPAAALACARAIQRSLAFAGQDRPAGALRVRIGADAGPVVEEDGDLLGLHVNLAARITAAAKPGEILASVAVRDRCGAGGEDLRWGRCRNVRIRGLSHRVRVSALDWATATAPASASAPAPAPAPVAQVRIAT